MTLDVRIDRANSRYVYIQMYLNKGLIANGIVVRRSEAVDFLRHIRPTNIHMGVHVDKQLWNKLKDFDEFSLH